MEGTKCMACSGTGKVSIQASELRGGHLVRLPAVEIQCVTCHGRGCLTDDEVKAYKKWAASWCTCGNPSGEATYFKKSNGFHGWSCKDCGKILQVG